MTLKTLMRKVDPSPKISKMLFRTLKTLLLSFFDEKTGIKTKGEKNSEKMKMAI